MPPGSGQGIVGEGGCYRQCVGWQDNRQQQTECRIGNEPGGLRGGHRLLIDNEATYVEVLVRQGRFTAGHFPERVFTGHGGGRLIGRAGFCARG